jgi:hypothetical protein
MNEHRTYLSEVRMVLVVELHSFGSEINEDDIRKIELF